MTTYEENIHLKAEIDGLKRRILTAENKADECLAVIINLDKCFRFHRPVIEGQKYVFDDSAYVNQARLQAVQVINKYTKEMKDAKEAN